MDVHPTKNVSIGIDPYPHVEPDIFFLRFGSKWLGGFLLTCFPTFQDLSGGHFPSPVRTEGDFLFQLIFLVGGLEHEFYFAISYMGCHPSHWRTPSFFKMVIAPPTRRCEEIPSVDWTLRPQFSQKAGKEGEKPRLFCEAPISVWILLYTM